MRLLWKFESHRKTPASFDDTYAIDRIHTQRVLTALCLHNRTFAMERSALVFNSTRPGPTVLRSVHNLGQLGSAAPSDLRHISAHTIPYSSSTQQQSII